MYTRFYGFSEKPFNVTPDPKFLFLTESHQKALEAMLYGVGERKGFVSISGEAGTGKTTILHHVLNTLDKNIKTVFISQTQVTPKQLLKEIVQKIGLPPRDQSKISLIRQLNEHLLSALSQEGNLAVLIDEAQNLSLEVMEELRMLSNLETANSKLIQMVFVGQPELETKLNSRELRQLKQRIAIRSQIRPLTAEESRQYIDHRLRLVGRSTGEVFNPEAAGLIVRHAEGIPRTINLLCDHALLIGYRRKEKRIPVATAKEVLSNRGMMVEEKGKKIVSAPLRGARIRRSYRRDAFWGIPAALALILIFLAGMGHLGFLTERVNLIFAKNEAVATPEEVSPSNSTQEKIPEPPDSIRISGREKRGGGCAPGQNRRASGSLPGSWQQAGNKGVHRRRWGDPLRRPSQALWPCQYDLVGFRFVDQSGGFRPPLPQVRVPDSDPGPLGGVADPAIFRRRLSSPSGYVCRERSCGKF